MKFPALFRNRHSVDSGRIALMAGTGGWLSPFFGSSARLSPDEFKRILRGEFRVFSRTLKPDGNEMPDWHRDYLNGYSFSKSSSGRIRINELKNGDCLFPCELSRLQFLPPLFTRSNIPEESLEAETFLRAVLADWQKENPPGYGIHWRMHMESAIRSLVLLTLLPFVSRETAGLVLPLAFKCLEHVADERILRPPGKRHNHYLIELACMIMVSDVLKSRKLTRARNKAFLAITEELRRQFHEDGVNFECSLSYHRLTVEALLLLYSYLKKACPGDPGSKDLEASLETILPKALSFVKDYSDCFGRSPQFGDSSDGRMLFSGDYFSWDPLDHGYLLRIAEDLDLQSGSAKPEQGLHLYRNSGYALLFNHHLCGAVCNPVITEKASGHSHQDRLSWTLAVAGKPVFIDPGTWMYNSDIELRKYFKSTGSHNTLMIDNEEQAVTDFTRAFSGITGITCSIDRHQCGGEIVGIKMSHSGYSRLPNLGEVERTIEIGRNEISVSDHCEGASSHYVSIGYLVHPEVQWIHMEKGCFHLSFDGFSLIVAAPDSFELKTEEKWYSDSYGEKIKTWRIVMCGAMQFPARIEHSIKYKKVNQVD